MELKKAIMSSTPATVTVAATVEETFKDRVPSNWDIKPLDEDTIVAVSNVTNERFEGTVQEFNKKLKG
jgi:hypothetical protein